MSDPLTTYHTDIDVRLRDVDFMGHVNNAVYATYLEQARAGFFRDVLEVSLDQVDTVLARLELEYHRPIEAEQRVGVELRVPELGTSSIPMSYTITADGASAATGKTVQVVVDRETGASRPIPDAWRERLE
ncbi:acyl-CoA thioesterase [Natronosalvus vescus]|uniref:acyl-CoA thioesterase n=1 Tax=Natronosalvus vescus TaxID=2953881 RepID=UPI00209134D3|nr:thioesterase family protein [Natronosalvus vescus]